MARGREVVSRQSHKLEILGAIPSPAKFRIPRIGKIGANEVSDARNRRCLEWGSGDFCRGSSMGEHSSHKRKTWVQFPPSARGRGVARSNTFPCHGKERGFKSHRPRTVNLTVFIFSLDFCLKID